MSQESINIWSDSVAGQSQAISALFDVVSEGYDRAELRFYPFCADSMVGLIQPVPGQKILDVGTGTGAAAIAMAQIMRRQGRVIGVDLSERMIEKAMVNAEKMALTNVDFFVMDGESLEFKSDYFDHTVCAFALYYMPDMLKALTSWRRVTKPGGKVLCTGFSADAFGDLFRCLFETLQSSDALSTGSLFKYERLARPDQYVDLFEQAGLKNIQVNVGQFGYHLASPEQWWEVLWRSDVRSILQSWDNTRLLQFKGDYLHRVAEFIQPQGLWLDVKVIFGMGEV